MKCFFNSSKKKLRWPNQTNKAYLFQIRYKTQLEKFIYVLAICLSPLSKLKIKKS